MIYSYAQIAAVQTSCLQVMPIMRKCYLSWWWPWWRCPPCKGTLHRLAFIDCCKINRLRISHQFLSKAIRKMWGPTGLFFGRCRHLTLGEASMISRQLGTTPKLTIRNVLHPQQSRPCSPLAEKRTCLSLWCLGYSQRLITDFWNACSSSKPRGITSAAGMICHHTQQDLPDSDWQE